ncbi:MAG: glycosyltransferase [Verrucomicrobia bacterium]|jgi:glycosyltransferase involved in cell wall biosynthesis|nr:glycosyltransferase [Verrucomicrobiota bacterium]
MKAPAKTHLTFHSEKTRILHLSTTAQRGGAAAAALSLHRSLRREGLDSRMIVREHNGLSTSDGVYRPESLYARLSYRILKNAEIHLPRLLYRNLNALFSPAWTSSFSQQWLQQQAADIIHFHWINFGAFPLHLFSNIPGPVVWTFHDMWPFTGGCHYAGDCERYRENCGSCPTLGSSKLKDLSFQLMKRKKALYQPDRLSVVCPSHWMAKKAGQSALFKDQPIHVIPNGIDCETFQAADRIESRRHLGIDPNGRYLFFAAVDATSDPRKGFDLLREALARLSESGRDSITDLKLLIAGSEQIPRGLPFPVVNLGRVKDRGMMAKAYAAADVFVAPSLEDNLPNTVLESLACGTPVVAFNTGGMPDMIMDSHNGRLVILKDPASLAEGITWVLEHPDPSKLREAARVTVENKFTLGRQVEEYVNLYKSLL